MDISIIIINFNTARLTTECIEKVMAFTKGLEYEIILIDNASTESQPEIFKKRFPEIKLIKNSQNVGFSRANNQGIKVASGNAIVLLNSDVLLFDNAIDRCYQNLWNSEYIASGIQLLNQDGSFQISGNYFITGGVNQLLALPYVGKIIRWLGYKLRAKKTNVLEAKGVVEVDWINGAFLMVKRSAIVKAGLMDEDFFLYSEEIEWCSRLGKVGKMCIYGDINAIHLQGSSAGEAFASEDKGYYNLFDRKGRQLMLSNLIRIRKQYGIGWFLFHFLSYFFAVFFFFIILVGKTIFFRKEVSGEWKRWKNFSINTISLCQFFVLIIKNKPHFYKVL